MTLLERQEGELRRRRVKSTDTRFRTRRPGCYVISNSVWSLRPLEECSNHDSIQSTLWKRSEADHRSELLGILENKVVP